MPMDDKSITNEILALRSVYEHISSMGRSILPILVFYADGRRRMVCRLRHSYDDNNDKVQSFKEALAIVPALGADELLIFADSWFTLGEDAESGIAPSHSSHRFEAIYTYHYLQETQIGIARSYPYIVSSEDELFWVDIPPHTEPSEGSGTIPNLVQQAFAASSGPDMGLDELRLTLQSLGHFVFVPRGYRILPWEDSRDANVSTDEEGVKV